MTNHTERLLNDVQQDLERRFKQNIEDATDVWKLVVQKEAFFTSLFTCLMHMVQMAAYALRVLGIKQDTILFAIDGFRKTVVRTMDDASIARDRAKHFKNSDLE